MQVGATGSGIFGLLDKAELKQAVLDRHERFAPVKTAEVSASDRIALRQSASAVTSSQVKGLDGYRETAPGGLYLLERLASAGLATGYMDAVFASAANRTAPVSTVQAAYQEAAAYAE